MKCFSTVVQPHFGIVVTSKWFERSRKVRQRTSHKSAVVMKKMMIMRTPFIMYGGEGDGWWGRRALDGPLLDQILERSEPNKEKGPANFKEFMQ